MKRTKKQIPRDDYMDRARAARCLIDMTGGNNEDLAMSGFMEIFHPGHKMTRELILEAERKRYK